MRRVRLGLILITIIGVPTLGLAQWLRYPTADVPRTADGKPDLNGRFGVFTRSVLRTRRRNGRRRSGG